MFQLEHLDDNKIWRAENIEEDFDEEDKILIDTYNRIRRILGLQENDYI